MSDTEIEPTNLTDKQIQRRDFRKAYRDFCESLDNNDQDFDLKLLGCAVDIVSSCFTLKEYHALNHRNKWKCYLHMMHECETKCEKCFNKYSTRLLTISKPLFDKPEKKRKTRVAKKKTDTPNFQKETFDVFTKYVDDNNNVIMADEQKVNNTKLSFAELMEIRKEFAESQKDKKQNIYTIEHHTDELECEIILSLILNGNLIIQKKEYNIAKRPQKAYLMIDKQIKLWKTKYDIKKVILK